MHPPVCSMESPKQFNVIWHTWTALLLITYNQHRCTHVCVRMHARMHTHTCAHIYIPDKGQKLFSFYRHSILAILLDVQINVRGFNYRQWAETILCMIKYIWENWNWKKFDFSFMWKRDYNGSTVTKANLLDSLSCRTPTVTCI